MNYLVEINAFYRWLETHELPSDAINLWHALMNINNGTHWKDTFSAAISTLESKTGCDRKRIFKARKRLTEANLVQWESSGSHHAASYSLIPISSFYSSSKKSPRKPEIFDPELDFHSDGENDSYNLNDADSQRGISFENLITGSNSAPQNGVEDGSLLNLKTGPQTGPQTGPINKEKEKLKEKKIEPKGSLSSRDDFDKSVREIFIEYNLLCKNCIPAKILTDKRRTFIGARLRDYGYNNVIKMLTVASKSDFLAGSNRRKWIASIEFLFGPVNFVKVLEGNYNNRATMISTDNYNARPSSLEIIAETYNNLEF